jgi:hypothetical protein
MLDTYINNNSTKNYYYIYINENQNWTDTTSVISFSLVNKKINNKNVKSSVYKKHKIIYLLSSFNKGIDKNNTISNKLKWNGKFKDNNKLIDNIVLEYEMQFIYDIKNKCITKILKSYPVNDNLIIKDIEKCLCRDCKLNSV